MKLLYSVIAGIVLAGIVHITIILLIPQFGTKDAWAVIARSMDPWRFSGLSENQPALAQLSDLDPQFKVGACRFDLADGGLRIRTSGNARYWSASVFDRGGTNVYNLNNRTAIQGRLELVIVNPEQMIRARENPPEDLERAVVVEADINAGFVFLRVWSPDESWHALSKEFLESVVCEQYQL